MSGDHSEDSYRTIVKSDGGPRVILVQQPATQLVAAQPAPRVVLAGVRGRPGRDGLGSGVTYTQDSEPQNAAEKESWYNPLTLQMKVYHDGAWRPVSPDGGHF